MPPRRTFRSTFKARLSSVGATINCLMENISVTGMLFEAGMTLQKGEKLLCTLILPSAPPFVAQVEVVRTSREQSPSTSVWYGARFSRLDPAARSAIERVLR